MRSGFDPKKDLMMNHNHIEGTSPANFRSPDSMNHRGGVLIDWDLKSTVDGLYAAGEQTFAPAAHGYSATTGRYAGRKAARYAMESDRPTISREQIEREKARVYAPIKRKNGMEWKELHAGIARTMQYFCSEFKTERLLNMGLDALKDIEENYVPTLYAIDPHKLLRSLEDLSILKFSQLIIQASLARKASCRHLNFERIDYPQQDPPEFRKFITLKEENGRAKLGERPLDYWGDLTENYRAHNPDYTGVYKE